MLFKKKVDLNHVLNMMDYLITKDIVYNAKIDDLFCNLKAVTRRMRDLEIAIRGTSDLFEEIEAVNRIGDKND